jgi:hypothetical protein
MVVPIRALLVLVLLLAAMGLAATSGGRVLTSLHTKAGCNTVVVDDGQLATCHKGWWKPAPNLTPLGCNLVGINVWSCPADVKP